MAFEKVNMYHPDKIVDRVAGAITDLAYSREENPKLAVEAMIGHGECNIIIESSVLFKLEDIVPIVGGIAGGGITVKLKTVPQDECLASNQIGEIKCGDNGIFKGIPLTEENKFLSRVAREITGEYPSDGKYIYDYKNNELIVCQSLAKEIDLKKFIFYNYGNLSKLTINPLGDWVGGIDVDTGAVNRKLGSDMADSITGGGLWGKDLSKADVSCNIWAFEKAQELNKPVELYCAIGDTIIRGYIGNKEIFIPYKEIVDYSKEYINSLGGFEAAAEWGLI